MKLLHISDLHIGKRVNGISMIDDQRHMLENVVAIACEREVDAVMVAGDLYDKASPSAEAVMVFDAFLGDVVGKGIKVIAVPGNHDSAERIAYAQCLLSRNGVHFPPVFDGAVEKVVLEDDFGKVCFWLLPFVKPGDVRRFFPDAEIADDYSAALRAVIASCDIDSLQRNVAISHQLVIAGSWSPERSDDEIKLGGIDNVDFSVYDGFDYVALGHVHRPQRVGRDTVRYSGSPLKYSFSEARYPKSVAIVELAEKAGTDVGACVSVELVAIDPLHDMREVRGTLQDLLDAGSSGDRDEDYLHITLTDEHPQLDAMAKIRDVYPNAMALDYESSAVFARSGSAGPAVDPDELDIVELFGRFYEEQVEDGMDEMQKKLVSRVAHQVGEQSGHGGDGGQDGES